MKINEQQIVATTIDKALSSSLGDPYTAEALDPTLVMRYQVQPKLLTALFGGIDNDKYLDVTTFKYDDVLETMQLPGGKSYQAYGPDLQKDKARRLAYDIGSFGLRYNAMPRDYAGKFVPGTNTLMTEAYIIDREMRKASKGWTAFSEMAYAQLLTTDTNITRGAPEVPSYNYYTDIYGTARPAKVDMDLNGTGNIFKAFAEERDKLDEELDRAGLSASGYIVICGTDFFDKRYDAELQEGNVRELRGTLDLASMQIPRDSFGGSDGVYAFQNFTSHDGFTYVRYGASIDGSRLIGNSDAYIVPVGVEGMFKRVFAPAQDRPNVNRTARSKYVWTATNDRTGIHVAEESNVLYFSVHPKLIRHLTTST